LTVIQEMTGWRFKEKAYSAAVYRAPAGYSKVTARCRPSRSIVQLIKKARGRRRETGSFRRRDEAHRKERSVVRKADDADERARAVPD